MPPVDNLIGKYKFVLAQSKVIKSRTVYNWITMLSEVSGFADILIVFPSFFLGLFYTPMLKEYAIAREMGPVSQSHHLKKPRQNNSLVQILLQISRYKRKFTMNFAA